MQQLSEVLGGFEGPGADGTTAMEAPLAWGQGRTLYGGMTGALCLQAALDAMPDLPPLRSAQICFVGPASGRLTFRCELLRRGRSTAIVGVDCRTEAGVAARCILTFGAARDSRVVHDDMPAPDAPPPDAVEPLHRRPREELQFAGNFDIRLIRGGRPASGGDPELLVWARLHEDDERADPLVALLALADALPPGAMAEFPKGAPVSTMTWSVDLFQPVTRRGWHRLHTFSEQAADGYSLQGTHMWDDSGRRILTARQVVALFA